MGSQRALCVMRSWFLSMGIPHEIRGTNLVVNGMEVEFDSAAILHKDFNISMAEVRRVVERFVERFDPPREPTTRRAASDDLLARSMRLTAFSKTANPPASVLAKYAPIVKREADRAHRQFTNLNHALLLDAGDYFSVGMVFLTIYLHRYQDLEQESRNGADLTLYLQQEFRHWDKVLHHDLPSIAVDARGMLAEQFMSSPVPGGAVEWWNTWEAPNDGIAPIREPSYTMPEYAVPEEDSPDIFQEGELPHHLLPELLTEEEHAAHVARCPHCLHEKTSAKDARKRREAAKQRLVDALDGLGHDRRVEALTEVVENPYLDPEARDLASTLLRKHISQCPGCAAAWTAWTEEHAATRRYMTTAARAAV